MANLVEDPTLPAASFLTGTAASDVLRMPIEAAGGSLHSARPVNIHYRPGSDLVVRYSTQVSWPGKPRTRETHMAACAVRGPHAGTVPVESIIKGRKVTVGVWRWPFDPVLHGLGSAVTKRFVADLCEVKDRADLSLKVVAFRPTERAVIRATTSTDEFYLKVMDPRSVGSVVARHAALAASGVPVANLRTAVPEAGIVVFDALRGATLRDGLKAGCGHWPTASAFDWLASVISGADIEQARPVASRLTDGVLHAAMLAEVMPGEQDLLENLSNTIRAVAVPPRSGTIHGDLHEGQLLIDRGQIVGVLDIDDVGPGAPIDDRASLLAFLRFRAITVPKHRARITQYADELRSESATSFPLADLDVHTAAVLLGLATGPFRIQQQGWETTVHAVLTQAAQHLTHRRTS